MDCDVCTSWSTAMPSASWADTLRPIDPVALA